MAEGGKVLLTGATGRLGRAVMPQLADLGVDIRCLVLPDDPGAAFLASRGVEIVRGKLETGESLGRAVDQAAWVVHMAARLPGAGTSDRELVDSIAVGTFNLLDAIETHGIRGARFLYVSSSAVYGPQLPAEQTPIPEDHPTRPTSVYAASKASAEAFVVAYTNRGVVRATIVRPADIVESADFAPDGFMARRFRIDEDSRRVIVPIDEAGRAGTMSFLSAKETARGLLAALVSDAGTADSFHIGPWESSSDLQVGDALAHHLGWQVDTEVTRGPARKWILDTRKARLAFGFLSKEQVNDVL